MANSGSMTMLLSDQFSYYKKRGHVRVNLYAQMIKFYNNNGSSDDQQPSDLILHLNDVAGVRVGQGHEASDVKAYLTFYAYVKPINKKTPSKRKRLSVELAYSKYSTFDENSTACKLWEKQIHDLMKSHLNQRIQTTRNAHMTDTFDKPFLVFVNPKSGSGKAKAIYYERVLPVWAESSTKDTLVLTQCQNFVRDYVQKININDYRGILIISGDGVVYEVLNGLLDRPDWREAIRLPFGQIPGGSANALAVSSAHLAQEAYAGMSLEQFATQTAFQMSKAIPVPLDVVTYQLFNNKLVHSFLSLEWGFIADLDLETEKYRFMGNMRFAFGAVKNVLKLRVYRGRISFLPADEHRNLTPKNKTIQVRQATTQHDANNNLNQDEDALREVSDERFRYLTPLDKPVPKDWLVIEDTFVFFLATYLPLISPDFMNSKETTFNDGHIHLTLIKQGISKTGMLKVLTSAETASHLDDEHVEYIKVKAFRLEPLPGDDQGGAESEGVLMVDGERLPYGPLQAEIMPGLANVLANPK